jgi:hypothetical protein
MRRSRLLVHRLTDEIYGVPLYVLRGTSPQCASWVRRHFGTHVELGHDPACRARMVAGERDGVYMLFFIFPPDLNMLARADLKTVVHECLHATSFILCRRGLQLHDADNEAFAYHIAWLFGEVHAVLTERPRRLARIRRHRKGRRR